MMMVTTAHTRRDLPCSPYIATLTASRVALISYHATVTVSLPITFLAHFLKTDLSAFFFPKNALKIWRVSITQKESSFRCLPAPHPEARVLFNNPNTLVP